MLHPLAEIRPSPNAQEFPGELVDVWQVLPDCCSTVLCSSQAPCYIRALKVYHARTRLHAATSLTDEIPWPEVTIK